MVVYGRGRHNKPLEEVLANIRKAQRLKADESIDCRELTSQQLEEIGEAVMNIIHPDPAQHEFMDKMMGGEGSPMLAFMHRMMGARYLGCYYGTMPMMGMMGDMMGREVVSKGGYNARCPFCGAPLGESMYGMGMMSSGMRQSMMGPGMAGGGMLSGRRGMMGSRYSSSQGPMMGGYQRVSRSLTQKEATSLVSQYLASLNNPNLKLGTVKDKGTVFEAEITTKDNSLVDKIIVEKATGAIYSAYSTQKR